MAKLKNYVQGLIESEQENLAPLNAAVAMKSKIFHSIDKDLVLCIVDGHDFVITQEGYQVLKLKLNAEQLQTHSSVPISATLASVQYENLYTTEDVLSGSINASSINFIS